MKTKRKRFHRGAGGRESVLALQKQVSTLSHCFHHCSTRESATAPERPQFAFTSNLPDLQDASKGGRFPLIPTPPSPASQMAAPQPAQLAVSRFTFTQVSGNGQQRDN